MQELDRVLGGGGVRGSLILVGGAPGIGKSTLLLQICAYLGKTLRILYVSGEESEKQIKMRADRLQVASDELYILSETDLSEILSAVDEVQPDILIADSIQTLYSPENTSAPRQHFTGQGLHHGPHAAGQEQRRDRLCCRPCQ